MAMVSKTSKKSNGKSNYFNDVGKELKKVNYPNFSTVRKNTLIVIMLSIIVGIFIAALDYGFGAGATALLNINGTAAQTDTTQNDGSSNLHYDDNGNVDGTIDENGNFVPFDNTTDDGGASAAPDNGGQ